MGPVALTQPCPPVGEHREVHPGMVKRQATRHLPADVAAQRIRRLAVREALQFLEHQRHRHHVGGHRRPTPPRREQIREVLVSEQIPTMISQERIQRTIGHQLPTQRRGVQQLTVGVALALHSLSLKKSHSNREHRWPISSTVS